jgi:hypothetical protein
LPQGVLSEDEKQSLDDALSTLDDLYEATLKPDGGFRSELGPSGR